MQLVVQLLFVLLMLCIGAWLLLRRKLGSNPAAHPRYRQHQLLIGLIAALIILITLLIVFSSEPGDPDDYLWLL